MQYATYIRLVGCVFNVLLSVAGDESFHRPAIAKYSFCTNDTIIKSMWQPLNKNSRAGWFRISKIQAGCSSLHIYEHNTLMYDSDSICHVWLDKSTDGNRVGGFCLYPDGDTRHIAMKYIPTKASLLPHRESSTRYLLTFKFVSSRLKYNMETEASNIALTCSHKQRDATKMTLSCTTSVPAYVDYTSLKMLRVQFLDNDQASHQTEHGSGTFKPGIGVFITIVMMVGLVWYNSLTVRRWLLGPRRINIR